MLHSEACKLDSYCNLSMASSCKGSRCIKRTCSALLRKHLHDTVQLHSEPHVQQPVGFIQYQYFKALQAHEGTALHDIEEPPRGADQHLSTSCCKLLCISCRITACSRRLSRLALSSLVWQCLTTHQRNEHSRHTTRFYVINHVDVTQGHVLKGSNKGNSTCTVLDILPCNSRASHKQL